MQKRESPPAGFLSINKPPGVTAHDVVASVRRLIRARQVGHGGTLDPMATGVLPVAIGKATRLLRYLQSDKIYLAGILLGQVTTTDDIEGEVVQSCDKLPDEQQIASELSRFVGQQDQIPPLYSAVHHEGQRLYALARAGKAPAEIPSRRVNVYSVELISCNPPHVLARIHCSAGTYIRSIARDLGARLGCGGCLESLVREKAGPFALSDSLTLDELRESIEKSGLNHVLISPLNAMDIPLLSIDHQQRDALCKGQAIQPNGATVKTEAAQDQPAAIAVTLGGELVAICRPKDDGRLQPEVVLANAERNN